MGYVRVSTPEENPENQEMEIKRFCERSGIELLGVFRDVGVSGSVPALERDGFRKLVDAAEVLGVRTIVVYDLTRLGRDMFDILTTYRFLTERGFNIMFVSHPELNSTQPSGLADTMRKLIITVLSVAAEIERKMIIERTKAGLARAKAEGKKIGRPECTIPVNLVKKYREMGLSKKDIYRLLTSQGYLRHKHKGKETVLSYDTFLRKLAKLGID